MHFADSIIVFIIALILFGPKKLPEIGRQVGKLLAEFRKASNEFKSQIDEELRVMEQQERQKRLEVATEQAVKQAALAETSESTTQPTIMPPSTGETVSASSPYTPATPELPAPLDSVVEPPSAHETAAQTNGHQEHMPERHAEHETYIDSGHETHSAPETTPAPIHHG